MEIEIKLKLEEAYKKLIKSEPYEEHMKKKSFLSSAFVIIDAKKIKIDHWNFNFFNDEDEQLTSFLITEDKVTFKETSPSVSDKKIKHLELEYVKVSPKQAIEMALNKAKEKLHGEPTKLFLTLHNNEEHKNPTWTITAMGSGLEFFKLKIDAVTETLISSEVKHLFQLTRR